MGKRRNHTRGHAIRLPNVPLEKTNYKKLYRFYALKGNQQTAHGYRSLSSPFR